MRRTVPFSLSVCVSLCVCVVEMQQGEDECCVALWWGHQTVANSTTSLFVIIVFFSSPPSPECRWDSWILNIWRKERIWASCARACVYVCAVRHVTVCVITYEYMCLHCSVNVQLKLQCVSVCLPVFWQVLVCILEARFILTCKWGVTAEIYFFNLESILIKFALAKVHFLLNVTEFMVTTATRDDHKHDDWLLWAEFVFSYMTLKTPNKFKTDSVTLRLKPIFPGRLVRANIITLTSKLTM